MDASPVLSEQINHSSAQSERDALLDIPDDHITQIHRVPPQFRIKKAHRDVYDPVIVSLGPYHHGKQQYSNGEIFKEVCVAAFVSESSGKDESFFLGKILDSVHIVRECYEQLDSCYSDEILVRLILRDVCFFVYVLEAYVGSSSSWETKRGELFKHFGLGKLHFIQGDLFLLENQIPIWIIKLILSLQSHEGNSIWDKLLLEFLNEYLYADASHFETYPSECEPFHVLDALRHFYTVPVEASSKRRMFNLFMRQKCVLNERHSSRFRSITNLKWKGIHLRQNNQSSFTSHALYGQLELPLFNVTLLNFVLFSNAIAYEMSPNANTDLYITSFISFIKSLIESPNDVKLLREDGILFSNVASDDEIFKMFKDLDTFHMEDPYIFFELKERIEKHCSNKARTWVAELINIHFHSPWTAMGLLAAFILLCLTIVQTYFAIRPVK